MPIGSSHSIASRPARPLGRADQALSLVHSASDARSAAGMRIALFSGNYNNVRDGCNQALNRLVAHLIAEGAVVRVYSPTTSTPAFEPAGDLVSVPSLPIPGRSEFRLALGMPRAIREDLKAFAPNLIHVSAPEFLGSAAQKFARQMNVPIVASLHTRFETYFDYYRLGAFKQWGERHLSRFYQASDRVLAPNDDCAQHVVDMGLAPSRVAIWGRGIDPQAFNPGYRDMGWRREQGYCDNEIVPLFFGRLVLEKGIGVFVETMQELRARGYRLRPLIVGKGPEEARMRDLLPDAIFTGHLDAKALGRAVASAGILVNPSITEAFGNVNLEAMASGVAVVSADAGSARALIESGKSGLLVAPTAVKLADATELLIRDPEYRRSLAAAALATSAQYRWPEILDGVVRVYREVLGEHRDGQRLAG